jgi:GTP cyclohydrolase I
VKIVQQRPHFDERYAGRKANDNVSDVTPTAYDEGKYMKDVIETHFGHILDALGIDRSIDHNTEGTAKRVAKMFVDELFAGRYQPRPRITDFPNAGNLDELYVTGPITVRSMCSHHFVPIHGRAWIGVLPSEKVIGLSKFNRLVQWIAARPQIQEEMTVQIADEIEAAIAPRGVAVIVKATHHCMISRGVKEHSDAVMTTSVMRGRMRDNPALRAEFLELIK